MPTLQGPELVGQGAVAMCQYSDGKNPAALRIYYQTGSSKSGFAISKQAVIDTKQSPTDIAGLGELAFSTTSVAFKKEFNMIVFLHQGTQVTIVATAPLARVEALARQIIAKL